LQEGFEQLAEECQMAAALDGLSSVHDKEDFGTSSAVGIFSILTQFKERPHHSYLILSRVVKTDLN